MKPQNKMIFKRSKCTILFLFIFFAGLSGFAQNTHLEKSLLWKIEGNGLKKPSYLFGTVHMICQDNFKMLDKVKKAITNTDQSYLEINLAAPDMAEQAQKFMMSDKSLKTQISKETYDYLDALVKSKLKTDLSKLDRVKPMLIVAALVQASFTCKVVSFESEVIKLTTVANKNIYGLSSIEEQYSFLDKVFDPKELDKYLKELNDTEIAKLINQIHSAYEKEDLAAIDDLLIQMTTSNPEGYHQLLPVRNKLWIERIPAIISTRSTFIAVGSGHLVGREGLINLLKVKGYLVTPVYH